jgi:ABC-type phosphate/phosphonate transport system substrate-binding protein
MTAGTRLASLPMYDWPEVQWANDALWGAIAERLRAGGLAAPEKLERGRGREEVWLDRNLLLSQTCAWPYITRLKDKVRLVGTPQYDVDGAADGFYSSFLVTRAAEPGDSLAAFRSRRFAVNGRDSLSGYVALRSAMQAEGLAEGDVAWVETGSHRESVRAVAAGRAELASIDCVCWALAGQHEAEAVQTLRVINRTPLRPGLPMITSGAADDVTLAALRAAVKDALAGEDTLAARQALFLAAIALIEEQEYGALAHLA